MLRFGCALFMPCDSNWIIIVVNMCSVSVRKCYKGEKPSVNLTLGRREEVESEMIPLSLLISESAATRVALMISELQ
jgi:hypothetical protein